MNELDIKKKIDDLIRKAESKLDEVFAKMLAETLAEINRMYLKYAKPDGDISWTDVNKYNRLQALLKQIAEIMNTSYQDVVKLLEQYNQTIYLENYLQNAYLLTQFTGTEMGFTIPTMNVINAALLNPIEHLTLPKVLEVHRNEIVRKIQITISQSLIRGEGYYKMAKEIETTVGFNKKKAMLVARTEGARSMSISDEKVFEQASKYVKMDKVWLSQRDLRVRKQHRTLDGQRADEEGYFHYRGLKAKGPCMWGRGDMDIQCRCVTIKLVKGYIPQVMRARNYNDKDYQERLENKIAELMHEEGLTYLQAFQRANKRIQPPSKLVPYQTYNEWFKSITTK